jgi:hypothetical protein
MTLKRRLDAVETSLSPTQLVLRWLADAHAYGSVDRYVASLVQTDPPVNPLDRLAREATHGAQAAMRGKHPDVAAEAVRSALRETVFRFEVVVQINVTAHEFLEREGLIDAALAACVALLASEKPRPAKYAERLARLRKLLALRVSELRAAQEARSIAEKRYLGGHGPLFPDVAAAWDQQLARAEAIADLAVQLTEVAGVPPEVPSAPETRSGRTTELVSDLVQLAKSSALEKLGEGEQAFGIAAEWVRHKFADARTPETQTTTLQP